MCENSWESWNLSIKGPGLMGRRFTLRCFIPILCGIYFITIYIFHGRLQYEMLADDDETLASSYFYSKNGILKNGNFLNQRELKRKVLQSGQYGQGSFENSSQLETFLKKKTHSEDSKRSTRLITTMVKNYDKRCFLSANYTRLNFTALETSVYLYSAYLDERYDTQIIRIMSLLALEKKERTLEILCHFNVNGTLIVKKATMYELCENHGKKYGGFIWSCQVPSPSVDVCRVNVSLNIITAELQQTSSVTIPVTKLSTQKTKFNYSICVPPLFGNIDTYKLIEFIELNRIFGVEHFIFYDYDIKSGEVLKLLNYYSDQGLVTLIDWRLPSVILKNQLWYNGQLSAHNDCLYRAMSLTKYLAIIDIDEYVVPHNNKRTFHESFEDLFTPDICGLSFDSAFYDPKFTNLTGKSTTGLVTIDLTGRSKLFSKVRTKVMVQPAKVFEVGIHHISKPASEDFQVLKVNTSVAYLHHYRNCVPNYGMKCGNFETDENLQPLADELQEAVHGVQAKVLN